MPIKGLVYELWYGTIEKIKFKFQNVLKFVIYKQSFFFNFTVFRSFPKLFQILKKTKQSLII